MEARASDIGRLPPELLSAALAGSTPRDAGRAAMVSSAFRAAADSDTVWARFLPSLELVAPEPQPQSKKDLFLRLLDGPVLLRDRLMTVWLDRETLAKCYMLSARKLSIASGDMPQHWSWIPLSDSMFSEGAQLNSVTCLEIRGSIHNDMLSPDTYGAYLVFKKTRNFSGFNYPIQMASVCFGPAAVMECTSPVLLGEIWTPPELGVARPQRRADGWMEISLGPFYTQGYKHFETSFSLLETKGVLTHKSGLIVHGIEIRREKSG